MSCEMENDLTAYLDHELPPARAEAIEANTQTCDGCRVTLQLLRRTIVTVEAMPPAFAPSPNLRARVLGQLVDPPSLSDRLRGYFRPVMVIPAAAAVAAVGLAVVAAQGHHRGRSLNDPAQLELAANYDLLQDYEVLGVDDPADLDVVEHLNELAPNEVKP